MRWKGRCSMGSRRDLWIESMSRQFAVFPPKLIGVTLPSSAWSRRE